MRYRNYGSSNDSILGFLWFVSVVILTSVLIYLFQPVADFLRENTTLPRDVIEWAGGIVLLVLSVYLTWTFATQFSNFIDVKNDLRQCTNFGIARAFMGYLYVLRAPLILIVIFACALGKYTSHSASLPYRNYDNAQRESGELNDVDSQDMASRKAEMEAEMLSDPTWVDPGMTTGKTPDGLIFTPRKDRKINNYLEITVGNNTDVVVKLASRETDECFRYVYVRSNDTYRITNIPQGHYYLKIAYGKNWRQKMIEGRIVGKFLTNAQYEIGSETLDYNIIYGSREYSDEGYSENYSIPSYSVSLNVVQFAASNSFDTNSITEDEFNE